MSEALSNPRLVTVLPIVEGDNRENTDNRAQAQRDPTPLAHPQHLAYAALALHGKLASVPPSIVRIFVAAVLLLSLASCTGEDPPPTYPEKKDTEVKEPPLTSPEEKNSPSVFFEEEGSPFTYISLGDSLAVGVGASDPRKRGYTPLYRDLLEREMGGREVRLIGLGVSGETTESFVNDPNSQLTRAERALKDNPGAVITLSLGANDLLAEAGSTAAEREEALAQYAQNLDHILKTLKNASTPRPQIIVLALYNPAPGSFTDEWAGRLNAQVRAVAEENGASVAAGDEAFRGREAEYAHYARDPYDIHPTDEGYEALARAFFEAS